MGRSILEAAYAEAGRNPASIEQDEEYIHNAITWLYQVKRVVKFSRRLSPEQYLLLRYEDICIDPVRARNEVARFIGTVRTCTAPLDISVSRLRNKYDLSDPRINEVWALCGEVAFSLGYPLVAD